MSKELDEVLLAMSKRDRIAELFMSIGATHEQAEVAASTSKIADQFQWTGALLTFQTKAIYKSEDGTLVKDWVTENKFEFLLPAAKADDKPQIDPDVLARAKAGNMTDKSRIVRQLGSLAAADAVLSGTPEADDNKAKDDPAPKLKGHDNPWSAASWNVTAQAKLIREIGLPAAASIAKSAGSFVGATRPAKVA